VTTGGTRITRAAPLRHSQLVLFRDSSVVRPQFGGIK